MRTRRILGVAGLGAAVALGGLGAGVGPAAAGTDGTVCERLADRVARVPAIRDRIRGQVELLEERIDAVADPDRRTRVASRLQPRLDTLHALDDRLARQVALAEQRCPRLT